MSDPRLRGRRRWLAALLGAAAALAGGGIALTATPSAAPVRQGPLQIVAAENFYGDVARQLAGSHARIISVLSNPDADPHLFEVNVRTARAIAHADLIVVNGAGYDPWITHLIESNPAAARRTLEVAALMHRQGRGVNPHLWYDPATMPRLARALAARLGQIDPQHRDDYERRLVQFLNSFAPIDARIAWLHRRYAGQPVTATEPVADYLTAALGLQMRNRRFQFAAMNGTEPGARETALFEQSLRQRQVRLLLYNRQTSGYTVQRLLAIARQAGVPVVGVTETEPADMDYQQWMLATLAAIGGALAGDAP